MPADGSAGRPLKIFINYRHVDTQGTAWAIYMKLEQHFGQDSIFFDRGTLQPGMRWFDEIESHLAACGVFISLIGRQWMQILTAHQQQGLEDYVIKEIDLALRSGQRVTVIPVLVDDAELPDASQLPLSLRTLPDCQAVRLRPTNLPGDIDALIARLDEVRPNPTPGRPTSEAVTPGPPSSAQPTDRESVVPRSDEDRARMEEHYRRIAQHAGSLVVFLGAGANAEDRGEPWRAGSGMLPDDQDLAKYLASCVGLKDAPPHLAEIAQYAWARYCERDLFDWVTEALRVDSGPGRVYEYLAQLPKLLGNRYQLIVTPNYDAALVRAFRDAGEEFDVAVYLAPGSQQGGRLVPEGKFVHVPWEGSAQSIDKPNVYPGFPIVAGDCSLRRTVIVWINGAVDGLLDLQCEDNYVITEDHYINYMSGSAEEVVPTQLLMKLRKSNYLFLGYTIADWRLRVFLKRIWRGPGLGRGQYWAVEHKPLELDEDLWRLEEDLWRQINVQFYRSSLADYLQGLHKYLKDHSGQAPS
jgi:SIR2-like domain/TIR domain